MKYYNYNELKELILVNKDYRQKFREQTDLERNKLKEGLLFHKRVLEPLKGYLTFSGLTLIDGHHRWQLLPEVIEECEEFNLNIPVVIIKSEDAADEMLRTQLGRRNLSGSEIAQYIDLLITEDGLTANKAYGVVAQTTGKSKSTIQRIHKPELAEANRQYHREKLPIMGNFSPESIETSSDGFAYQNQINKTFSQEELKNRPKSSHGKKSKTLSKEKQIDKEFEEAYEVLKREPTIEDLEKENRKLEDKKYRLLRIREIIDNLSILQTSIINSNLKLTTTHISKAISEYQEAVKKLQEESEVEV